MAYARATAHIMKEEGDSKKHHLIWDGTSKFYCWEQTMNKMIPTAKEQGITFGMVLLLYYKRLWNLRITFPNEEICLAFIDISACFRFPRIVADLWGVFGCLIGSCCLRRTR